MNFKEAEIAAITKDRSEVEIGKIRVVWKFFEEMHSQELPNLSSPMTVNLTELWEKSKKELDTSKRAEALLSCFDEVNKLRLAAVKDLPVSEMDQARIVKKLTGIVSGFPTTVWERRARNLLDIADERRWNRSEFKEAEGYTIQYE